MILSSHVLTLADSSDWQTCVEKTREERGVNGQFFTPPEIARCLAEWFRPEGFNRRSLHLLDPGAGGGVLTAAVVDRIRALHASGSLPQMKEITLEIWELDEALPPVPSFNSTATGPVYHLFHRPFRLPDETPQQPLIP